MSFFSVIIPTYNRANYLPLTIKSIQNQTFKDWECIVVDDGSTDNTKDIVHELILNDSRIKYIYQDNAERSAARNNGVNHSSSNYICFLDSDDEYKDTHLADLYTEISKQNTPEALFFVNHTTLIDGVESSTETLKYDTSNDYFIKNSVIPVRVCISRSILNRFSFNPRIVIVEDAVLWTQIAFHYPVFHIEKENVIYRWHSDNSVNIKNNCFLPRLNGLKILFNQDFIKNGISKKTRNESLSNCYYGIAKHYEYKRFFFRMCLNIFISIYKDLSCKQNKAKIYMIYGYFR